MFNTEMVSSVFLRPSGPIRRTLLAAYNQLISDNDLFRPHDSKFGRIPNPSIYVLSGLRSDTNSLLGSVGGDGISGLPRSDYHGSIELVLGAHRVATVRDEAGSILYELLLRELVDPHDGAGGFTIGSHPVESKVRYPQDGRLVVYENSLRNIRLDLAQDVGLATISGTNQIGLNSDEPLPPWMRSPQTAGVSASSIGYIPAIPIAYLCPGTGSAVLARIDSADGVVPAGTVIRFGGYSFESISGSSALFDAGSPFYPFLIRPGVTSLPESYWSAGLMELFVLTDNRVEGWRVGIGFTVDDTGTVIFPAATTRRLILAPRLPTTPPSYSSHNGPDSDVLVIGPFAPNVTAIWVNGGRVRGQLRPDQQSIALPFFVVQDDEVYVEFTETPFTDASFDTGSVGRIGKYLALQDIPGVRP